jgi:signal transduction histidine kinase
MEDRPSVPPSLEGALLDVLVHRPGVGVAVYDRALRCVWVNEVLAEVAPAIAPHTLAILQRVLATGEAAVDVDVALETAADRRRDWTASFYPLRDDGGAIDGVVALAHDRTVAKAADRKLFLLLEASRVLATTLDPEAAAESFARLLVSSFADGCIVDVSEPDDSVRALAVVHTSRETQDHMRQLRDKFPPQPNERNGASNVMRTGVAELHSVIDESLMTNVEMDADRRALVRKIAPRSSMSVPLKARGRTFGAITVVNTRADRRFDDEDLALLGELAGRAALALDNARLYRDAQEANRTKDEFLGTVSHELRTPLTAILGWAHILEKKRDPDSIERGLAIIERNAKSQAQIIEDILDVSRIISGKLRLDLRAVDLGASVQAAIDVVRPAAEARGIELEVHLDPQTGAVLGDADRLQQVAWNLLSNAVKFTPKGGRVSLHMARVGSVARIVVRDTGKGIDPEFLPFVFERFRQADSSTSRAHAGLGLGLSIVRHIIELHGGYVRAESDGKGKGATFVVDVPLHAPTRVAESRVSSPAPSADGHRLDGLKVLVVDDEPDARELIAVILGDQGAEVTTAASATEAMRQIVAVRPDVLVSDIGMPGEDGYWLIRKVRALKDDLSRVPAIALTAYARADDARKAFLAGYQMHVAKPVEPATLTAVVFDVGGREV